jgi:hypothetical protein
MYGFSWACARSVVAGAAATVVLAGMASVGVSVAAGAASKCANEAIRETQRSTFLPDCRAFELVSGPGSPPAHAEFRPGLYNLAADRAAVGGGRVSYSSYYAPEGSAQPNGIYLVKRGADGWVGEDAVPPQSLSAITGCGATVFFSSQLASAVLADGALQTEEPSCGHNEPALVQDEPAGWRDEAEMPYLNVLLRESFEDAPSYRLVNRTPSTTTPNDAQVQDASADLSRVVFSESASLTANAPVSGEALYEWTDGTVRLVSVLPDGEGVAGVIVYPTSNVNYIGAAPFMHGASADGSRVFFTAEGKLFVRLHAEGEPHAGSLDAAECVASSEACSVQIDASQAAGPGGGGVFLDASPDGSRVFFMDEPSAKLTSDTVVGSGENLYEYEVATGRLTDLTPVSHAGLLGASGFGESSGAWYLYFVAKGVLPAGTGTGEPGLYVVHDGEPPMLVARLDAATDNWDWNAENLSVNVSPDGKMVAFDTAAEQSGYDNTPVEPQDCEQANGKPQPCEEIYLYEAETNALACVSCRPDGQQPQDGGAYLTFPRDSNFPAASAPGYLPRDVTDGGRVFFQTAEALLEEDTNGVSDVYEYEEGRLHLVSTGTSPDPSMFGEASENGDDVFCATTQALVGGDRDEALSLYDARMNGGFPPRAGEGAGAPECEGEEGCRPPVSEGPVNRSAASSTLTAPGNLVFSPPSPSKQKTEPRRLTRAQRLAKALAACRRDRVKKRRRACEARARGRYGAKTKAKANGHITGNGKYRGELTIT